MSYIGKHELEPARSRKRLSLVRTKSPSHTLSRSELAPIPTDLPDRLKYGDDMDRDVCAPKRGAGKFSMNQSIFSLISAAGKNVEFERRFGDGENDDKDNETTGGSEDDHDGPTAPSHSAGSAPVLSLDSSAARGSPSHSCKSSGRSSQTSKRKLFRSIHKLRPGNTVEREEPNEPVDTMSSSQILPTPTATDGVTSAPEEGDSSDVPLLSRMLKGEAEMEASMHLDTAAESDNSALGTTQVSLAERLMEIFELPEPEQVCKGELACKHHTTLVHSKSQQNFLAGFCKTFFCRDFCT